MFGENGFLAGRKQGLMEAAIFIRSLDHCLDKPDDPHSAGRCEALDEAESDILDRVRAVEEAERDASDERLREYVTQTAIKNLEHYMTEIQAKIKAREDHDHS